jgi:hypothetical protein
MSYCQRNKDVQITEAFLIIQENLIFLMKEEGEIKPVKIWEKNTLFNIEGKKGFGYAKKITIKNDPLWKNW